jgi:NAD(P)-dependent dehydrogenase (short-subunit alcohol dehydrogenase family)
MYGLLKDKKAIVTGAAQGIGKAIAQIYAENGADVLLCDLDEKKVVESAKEIADATGKTVLGMKCNVAEVGSIQSVVDRAMKEWGRIDVLVNSAGILIHANMLDMKEDAWDKIFAVNVKGTFLFSQLVGRVMKEQKNGKIVNLSSCSGKKPTPEEAAYCSTKSAVNGFTKVCALELGVYGINVNAICPGATDTEMVRSTFITSPEVEREWIEKTALKRLGRPVDQARVALFLASELSDHITGECIIVSAGEMMSQ